jgi:hypothetical protein
MLSCVLLRNDMFEVERTTEHIVREVTIITAGFRHSYVLRQLSLSVKAAAAPGELWAASMQASPRCSHKPQAQVLLRSLRSPWHSVHPRVRRLLLENRALEYLRVAVLSCRDQVDQKPTLAGCVSPKFRSGNPATSQTPEH